MQPPKNDSKTLQRVVDNSVVHSYTDTAYGQLDGSNKNKLTMSIVGVSAFVLLISIGIVLAVINGGKSNTHTSQQSQSQNDDRLENSSNTQQASLTETSQKVTPKKPIPKNSSIPPYPSDLRAAYVRACNPEDHAGCECEVDYFEQHYPVEQFRAAMQPGARIAGYDEVFSQAYLACET